MSTRNFDVRRETASVKQARNTDIGSESSYNHSCKHNGYTANLRAKILDFRGFDSSRILILRGGILMSIGNVPESLSQRILVGIILVGRLGVMIVLAEVTTNGHEATSLTIPKRWPARSPTAVSKRSPAKDGHITTIYYIYNIYIYICIYMHIYYIYIYILLYTTIYYYILLYTTIYYYILLYTIINSSSSTRSHRPQGGRR